MRWRKNSAGRAGGTLPKIVVPVHFAGQSCDMRRSRRSAENMASASSRTPPMPLAANISATVGDCRYCDIAVFSFHPVKIITTGEGGMALTNDSELAARMGRLRSHGTTHDPAR